MVVAGESILERRPQMEEMAILLMYCDGEREVLEKTSDKNFNLCNLIKLISSNKVSFKF